MTQASPEVDAPISILSDTSPGPFNGFEGAEKLLELWFVPSEKYVDGLERKGARKGKAKWTGLRQVEKKVWDDMLDEVQCKILSVIEGEDVDAYLLSESSMFVWPHKLILKTCGTTTLLLGIPTLLRIASETCGLRGVWRCFYSRKTFMFPDRQIGPHKDWPQEMAFLDTLFRNSSAYTVGRMNGDHWLLYLTPPQDDVLLPDSHASSSSLPPPPPLPPATTSSLAITPKDMSSSLSSSVSFTTLSDLSSRPESLDSLRRQTKKLTSPPRPDHTLEILMSRLDPSACESFYHPSSNSATPYTSPLDSSSPGSSDSHALGAYLSDSLGLSALLPNATIDSFLFSPCGFSSNAVQGDRYATIHVTPEEAYSYASFETNLAFGAREEDKQLAKGGPQSLQELVERVLAVFRPAKLSITLFVSTEEEEEYGDDEEEGERRKRKPPGAVVSAEAWRELLNPRLLKRYERLDRIVYEFEGYSLVYAVFQAL